MHKSFSEALGANLIEVAVLHDGLPFVVNGTQYYRATQDGINMLMGRFHALSDTIRRHDQLKLASEHIDTALATYDMLFRRIRAQANLDIEQVLDAVTEGMILNERLKQRKDMGLSVEQVYEIASIWFFSENEDPGAVDFEINRKKILDWTQWERAGELYKKIVSYCILFVISAIIYTNKRTALFSRKIFIDNLAKKQI
ncbi:hypothetical protein [Spirosoma oryzicola]|uniref:hypothetical protein n=1 Tax=Spirosoma oryzicola TaxID=2898794 RepID=UPI001E2DE68C|nr:hypothetical protein [Spirosoma oryzicola]UHG93237.1 hypothetical protein LQ777_10130 [Spirosoma oryzicola]